ncbi:hypothetical protein RSAG8_12583, partial [Rhizoctonia solani AG-8 WAC10335]
MSMRRYIPENSRRVSGVGMQSQPPPLLSPRENKANANGSKEQGAEAEKGDSESESESESKSERTGGKPEDP